MSTYPKADATTQWWDDNYSWAVMDPNCGVLHTTETTGWPGYDGGSKAPTVTARPNIGAKTMSFRQHFHDEHSSRALVNLAGGVSTNTANAIQIELVGTCDDRLKTTWGNLRAGVDYIHWPTAPDWALKAVAEWMVYLYKKHGIPLKSGLTFKAFPWGDGARMSFDEWRAFTGWCGHQHVPENTHGDPGSFPVQRVLDMAKAMLTPPAKTATTVVTSLDMRQIVPNERVTVSAAVTPAIPGVFHFQWSYPGAATWTTFANKASDNGTASTPSTPGADIVYRTHFEPTDSAKYAADYSPNVTLIVGDILALRAKVAELEAKVVAP